MLYIYFGEKSRIKGASLFFDSAYEDSWLQTEFAHRVVKEIDKSTIVSPKIIDSSILGVIPVDWLSTGTKQLLTMESCVEMEGEYFNGDQLGDNTLPFVLELASKKDIYLAVNHFLRFPKNMTDSFVCVNDNNKTYVGYEGWLDAFINFGGTHPYSKYDGR